MVPVLAVGFGDVLKRMEVQSQETELHQERLKVPTHARAIYWMWLTILSGNWPAIGECKAKVLFGFVGELRRKEATTR